MPRNGSHVADARCHLPRQVPLDGEVVPEERRYFEVVVIKGAGHAEGCRRRLIRAVGGGGNHAPNVREVRSRSGAHVGEATPEIEGQLRPERDHGIVQSLVVENPEPSAEDGVRIFVQRPVHSQAGLEVLDLVVPKFPNLYSAQRGREGIGNPRDQVVDFLETRGELPPQAVIHGQARADSPIVLGKETKQGGAQVPVGAGLGEQERGARAPPEGSEIRQAAEGDAALNERRLVGIPLEAGHRGTKLHGVVSTGPSHTVIELKCVLDLIQLDDTTGTDTGER